MNNNPRWQDIGTKPAGIGRPRIWADDKARKRAWWHRRLDENRESAMTNNNQQKGAVPVSRPLTQPDSRNSSLLSNSIVSNKGGHDGNRASRR